MRTGMSIPAQWTCHRRCRCLVVEGVAALPRVVEKVLRVEDNMVERRLPLRHRRALGRASARNHSGTLVSYASSSFRGRPQLHARAHLHHPSSPSPYFHLHHLGWQSPLPPPTLVRKGVREESRGAPCLLAPVARCEPTTVTCIVALGGSTSAGATCARASSTLSGKGVGRLSAGLV